MERGLGFEDVKKMQIGQVVDFCIDYNRRQERAEKQMEIQEKRGKRRKANQRDIDAFFG